MGRPRDFDEAETLRKAMSLFWLRGYQGTSLSDLEEALGVGRKSLYGVFGNKHELFLRAVDAYMQTRPPVETTGAGWESIVETLNGGPPYDRHYRACFMVNTSIEFGPFTDDDVRERVQRHNALLRKGFERAVENAIDEGDLPEQDAKEAALYLCTCLQGLSVMSRAGVSPSQLHRVATRTLESLRKP